MMNFLLAVVDKILGTDDFYAVTTKQSNKHLRKEINRERLFFFWLGFVVAYLIFKG